jgi:hypothetical protein
MEARLEWFSSSCRRQDPSHIYAGPGTGSIIWAMALSLVVVFFYI